jgi:hypothetical protein
MIKQVYLIVGADKRVRAVTRIGRLRDDEIAIRLNLTFPNTWGRVTSTLDVEIPDYTPTAELVGKYHVPTVREDDEVS